MKKKKTAHHYPFVRNEKSKFLVLHKSSKVTNSIRTLS